MGKLVQIDVEHMQWSKYIGDHELISERVVSVM